MSVSPTLPPVELTQSSPDRFVWGSPQPPIVFGRRAQTGFLARLFANPRPHLRVGRQEPSDRMRAEPCPRGTRAQRTDRVPRSSRSTSLREPPAGAALAWAAV